jgi:hypothetical protein
VAREWLLKITIPRIWFLPGMVCWKSTDQHNPYVWPLSMCDSRYIKSVQCRPEVYVGDHDTRRAGDSGQRESFKRISSLDHVMTGLAEGLRKNCADQFIVIDQQNSHGSDGSRRRWNGAP